MAEGDAEQCWICLDDAAEDGSMQLLSPCKCPRKVHPQCLARWQLQQAGRHEEKQCRFCNTTLADWKANLTPKDLAPEVSKVQPIMVVYFEGQIHRIPVKQGPDGLQEFQSTIRDLFRLPEDVDISLTFGCKEPMSGQHLKLEGVGAFDAAVHCASVAAADRQQKVKRSQSAGDLSGRAGSGAMGRSASGAALAPPPEAAGGGDERLRRAPAAPVAQQQRPGGRSRSYSTLSSTAIGGGGGGASPFAAPALQLSASPPPAAPTTPPQHAGGAGMPGGFRSILSALSGGDGGGSPNAGAGGSPLRGGAAAGTPPRQAPPPGVSGRGAAAALLRGERFSSRNITELTDVPEADETVAVGQVTEGSLGGKFKLTLKAFSRKVARTISFTSARGPGGAAGGAGGAVGGGGGSREATPRGGGWEYEMTPPAGGGAAPSPRGGAAPSPRGGGAPSPRPRA
ncbi:MAG: hypothetical protein J3K34DRAFT_227780 [Monoraphidium minutum]|nr:MAG: hypothetical protein J3K34DRAFT_227780 [Monoraphidium minutum]